jgi:hypothetical protein
VVLRRGRRGPWWLGRRRRTGRAQGREEEEGGVLVGPGEGERGRRQGAMNVAGPKGRVKEFFFFFRNNFYCIGN